MKDPLLLLLLVLVGLFLYFITVKGVIYPVMLFAMIVVTALWYFLNHYISQKMVKKARGEESFFFQKAQMVSPDGTELISGALVITESEVVFCSHKGYMVCLHFIPFLLFYRIHYREEDGGLLLLQGREEGYQVRRSQDQGKGRRTEKSPWLGVKKRKKCEKCPVLPLFHTSIHPDY